MTAMLIWGTRPPAWGLDVPHPLPFPRLRLAFLFTLEVARVFIYSSALHVNPHSINPKAFLVFQSKKLNKIDFFFFGNQQMVFYRSCVNSQFVFMQALGACGPSCSIRSLSSSSDRELFTFLPPLLSHRFI